MTTHNQWTGFTFALIWVLFSVVVIVVVSWRRFYLHKNHLGGYAILEDLSKSKLCETMNIASVMMFFWLMIESWDIIYWRFRELPIIVADINTMIMILLILAVYICFIRFLAFYTTRFRKALLWKRLEQIRRSRSLRLITIARKEMVDEGPEVL